MRAWEEFLTEQDKELGKETVDKWLRPLKLVRFDACNLYLESSDSFKALWFEEHMRHKVQTRLYNNNHKPIKVHIATASQNKEAQKRRKKTTTLPPSSVPFALKFDEIDPQATFSTFVSAKENILAYKLLNEAAKEKTGSLSYNPIYLFGRSGSGKTHLLMATAAALRAAGASVLYIRADTFTEHVVNAIRTGEMQTFRKMYRNVHALLIDDIEVFSRKGATQEELFHTFNTLHIEGKQIILSASSSPQELKFIEPRLVSRFEWGIVVPLQTLTRDNMKQVLLQRAERIKFHLEEALINFLLDSFSNSSKTLIRALEALVLRAHLNQESLPLSLKKAQAFLADLIQEEEKATLTPGKIIRAVAQYYGIRMDDILSKSQARECVLPRQIAMHLCREKLNLPFMKIGDIFSRDHSTVMASVRQIQKSIESKNPEITGPVKLITNLL